MVVILTTREVWKERNAIIFQSKLTNPLDLVAKLKDEGRTWDLAGAKGLEQFIMCN